MTHSLSPLALVALLSAAGCSEFHASSLLGNGERGVATITTTTTTTPPCAGDDCSSTTGTTGTDDTGATGHDCDDDDDDDDCDDDDDDGGGSGDADLPYDARLDVGDTYVLWDSFAEEGDLPAAILSVTMEDGGTWRLSELSSLTPFTVDQADCDHEGNRDTGRDRIVVRWQNADGGEDEDHLDLRYCD